MSCVGRVVGVVRGASYLQSVPLNLTRLLNSKLVSFFFIKTGGETVHHFITAAGVPRRVDPPPVCSGRRGSQACDQPTRDQMFRAFSGTPDPRSVGTRARGGGLVKCISPNPLWAPTQHAASAALCVCTLPPKQQV